MRPVYPFLNPGNIWQKNDHECYYSYNGWCQGNQDSPLENLEQIFWRRTSIQMIAKKSQTRLRVDSMHAKLEILEFSVENLISVENPIGDNMSFKSFQ